jgi:hypothetical protein
MIRRPIHALIIIALSILVVACSRAPSDDTIKSAITQLLKKEVPLSWSGSLLGSENIKIESIDILEIGKFNTNSQYWPVRARVKGNCQANILMLTTEARTFDKVGDFQLYQDDYENWIARINMMQ